MAVAPKHRQMQSYAFRNKKSKLQLQMNKSELKYVETEKDLGVTFDSKLTFRQHIRNRVSKANSRVDMIKRTFSKLSQENFKPLLKSLVRPLL